MSTTNPKSAGLASVRYVVMSFLNRRNDYTLKSYKRYVQIAIEGFGELNLWHLSNIEVVYLHMSEAKTVDLPVDYVDYLKIGVPVGGKLRVLTNKEQILLPRVFDDTGESVGNTDASDEGGVDIVFFSDHFRNGQFIGGLYGLPGGIDSAYWRIDRENRQIVFSGSVTRSEIVLEYISNGVALDGSSLIPREAIPALRSYIEWVDTENNPRAAYNEKERKKRIHEEEISALRHFQLCFTKDEFLRMLWGSSRQTPKR